MSDPRLSYKEQMEVDRRAFIAKTERIKELLKPWHVKSCMTYSGYPCNCADARDVLLYLMIGIIND
jgi:hypothetical protein